MIAILAMTGAVYSQETGKRQMYRTTRHGTERQLFGGERKKTFFMELDNAAVLPSIKRFGLGWL